jgi:oligosaccharyltransferase complex subunit delta (ribophorin II)
LFLGTLTAFDALIFYYWTSLKIFEAMPWFGVLGVLLVLSGREALGEIKRRRTSKEAKEAGKKKE